MNHSFDTTNDTSTDLELLDLVRRLELSHYVFDTDPNDVTQALKNTKDTPMQKLILRAHKLDDSNQIKQALANAHFHFSLPEKLVGVLALLAGILSVAGLLTTTHINFFYLLIILLGWHWLSLLLWLIRPKNPSTSSVAAKLLDGIIHKIMHKTNPLDKHAHELVMQSKTAVLTYYLSVIIHKSWVMMFLGNIIALIGIFLFKSYHFVWESTLLTQAYFEKLVHIIGILPSLFISPPDIHASDVARQFAIFLIVCVVIYGLIPRLIAWLFCAIKVRKHAFTIDKNLYYYENLVRQFNRQISDQDDYTPPPATPILAKVSHGKKLIATFEIEAFDPHWYQFGAGNEIVLFGKIDDKADLQQLAHAVHQHHAQVYLGIDCTLLPDRGTVKKLLAIANKAQFGIVVELLGNDKAHYTAWQETLAAHNIAQVRY